MSRDFKFIYLGLLILIGALLSCNKTEIPTVTTASINTLTGTLVTIGGNVVFDGGAMVTQRGVCWSTNNNPTIKDDTTSNGAGEGSYSSNIPNLYGATTYYVRAYATNRVGTGYGEVLSFKTLGAEPSVTTSIPTGIGTNEATFTGYVRANYLSTTVGFEYGTTKNYGQIITSAIPVTGISNTPVSIVVGGLAAGTTYHYRIKATNSVGTAYGLDMTFKTDL